MAQARHTARGASAGSPPHAAVPGPRLLARTWAAVTRSARRRRGAAAAAVCEGAGKPRSHPGRHTGPGAGAPGRLRRNDAPASPLGALRRERAHGAVASRTTGPDDLASLLDMLDLRPGHDGDRNGRGHGHEGRGGGGDRPGRSGT